jgi:serine/threonine protein kinase
LSEDSPAQLAGFRVGSLVGGYRLEAQVGAGGMAVVFRARDERLGRLVALKILAPALAADAAFRRRFIAESRAAAAVDDPHIIPVYEAGEADGVLFIAMRFVRGGDLRLVLDREGTLPPGQVAGFISPVASALDAAHGAGLVHRDVKPANILVDTRQDRPDHVYLSDFGVSKGAISSVSLTGAGHFVGTPDYSAPEQIQGWAVDGRTDQYALACVAYQLLTGATPFERDQGMAVLLAHLSQPPPSVSSRRPDLPGAADEVLARGMAKAPEKRYRSCLDFAEALREVLGLAPYHSFGSAPAADHPRTEAASPQPGFSGPDLARKEAAPASRAAAATTDWAPGSGPAGAADVPGAAVIAAEPADLGTHANAPAIEHRRSGSDSARRPPPIQRRGRTRPKKVAILGGVSILTAVVVAALILTSSPGHTTAGPQDHKSSTATSNSTPNSNASVIASGSFGTMPKVSIPKAKAGSKLEVKTLIQGTGTTMTKTDALAANFVLYSWSGTSSSLKANTFSSNPTIIGGTMLPGLETALIGKKVGSRVLAVIPPADGYGTSGNSQLGITGSTTLVFVIDMLKSYSDTASASGTQVSNGGGDLPTVSAKAGSAPTLTFSSTKPPSGLVAKTLIKGNGPKVVKGEYVISQYTGYIWRTKAVFGSSWSSGSPFGFVIGASPEQVIPGWDKGLEGQTVGSRVMLSIPPADGYGSAGNSDAGIKGTDSLVFVVDIIDALKQS